MKWLLVWQAEEQTPAGHTGRGRLYVEHNRRAGELAKLGHALKAIHSSVKHTSCPSVRAGRQCVAPVARIPVLLADWRQSAQFLAMKASSPRQSFPNRHNRTGRCCFAENRNSLRRPLASPLLLLSIVREGNRSHGEDSDHDCLLEVDSRFPYPIDSLMNAK